MRALIVGGGIGGLTLAAFLQNSNVEYDIIEKAPDWDHMGFLVSIWDSGRDILRKLGLAEEFDRLGCRADQYIIRDGKGRALLTIDLEELIVNYGSSVTIIERAALHNLLRSKVDQTRLRMSTTMQSAEQTNDKVAVTFSDGSRQEYDIVVGADGVHSQVRNLAFRDAAEEYENWRIWYTWIDNEFNEPGTVSEYVEPREFTIVCSARNKTTAWFFAPADHRVWDTVEGRAARLRELFKYETKLLPAVEKLRDEDIMPTDLLRMKLKSWSNGRFVLLGDAAHILGPLAGMGSSMAMEDAYTLAGEIMRISTLYPMDTAFKNYERKRKHRVRYVEKMGREMHFGMLIKSRALRSIMNRLFPLTPRRYLFSNVNELLRNEI
ncbi:MAG: FAD-dependent monooxygenase [Candidatus Kaiserbacteria bacterium]|nr:FAD-dependent monooxygenase [Candidatus Kaiserbacteria bacterium]